MAFISEENRTVSAETMRAVEARLRNLLAL